MTLKEALSNTLTKLEISASEIDTALIEAGINGADDYNETTRLAKATVEYNLLNTAYLESISEGGYTIKFNTELVKTRLSFLANLLGLDDPMAPTQPTITDKSYLW